jgi:carbon-monoxide dehydrogenase iron sulfur subunit
MTEPTNKKRLRVDYTRCTGCHLCEIACSLYNDGICNPTISKICVIQWEEAIDFPLVCHQCEDAPCVTVCPAEARMRNEQTWAIHVDREKCIGCRMCIYECPFGAISVQQDDGTTTNCLLCNGEPRCVQVCDTQAIRYVEPSEEAESLFDETRGKLKEYKATLE